MNYTNITLLALGFLGILVHNLVEMGKLNKLPEYNFTLRKYLGIEIFSILISIIVVVVAVMISHEIKQLEQAGKWLGFGFFAIGYMGQSWLIKIMGKADKIV